MRLGGFALAGSSVWIAGIGRSAAEGRPLPTKLDHILLWGRSIDEVTSILAVKLGFQVRPGHDPNGVANRYIRFCDRGYLELLGIARPNPVMDPGMMADQASLHGAAGSRSFGIYSSAPEQLRATLLDKGFPVTSVFSSPAEWRLFAFEKAPLSSNLFFIDYAAGYALQTSVADDRIIRTHPNGARALLAVWLLSSDANADRSQLARMGFNGGQPVRLPEIAARGYRVPINSTYVFALERRTRDFRGYAQQGRSTSDGRQYCGHGSDRAQRWRARLSATTQPL